MLSSVVVWSLIARAKVREEVADRNYRTRAPQGLQRAICVLGGLGYLEGQNIIVERRYTHGQTQDFGREMVKLKADVIVDVTTLAASAVINATKTIPSVHRLGAGFHPGLS